jgi:hypothetical protein
VAWSAIPTFTSGNVLTAAQMNILGGNLGETAPALATTGMQYFVATGANALAARIATRNTQLAADSTTSTSYTDLANLGPTLSSVVAGAQCFVFMQAKVGHNSALGNAYMGVDISGASTVSPDDQYALAHAPGAGTGFIQACMGILFVSNDGWASGTSTVQAKYKTNTGTATFDKRRLTAMPF